MNPVRKLKKCTYLEIRQHYGKGLQFVKSGLNLVF